MVSIIESGPWRDLAARAEDLKTVRTASLFADEGRASAFSIEAAGVFLDYSKNKIDPETMELLFALADKADVCGAIKRMISGDKINVTENRSVLHIALRDYAARTYHVDGEDVSQAVRLERERMAAFAKRFEADSLLGYGGAPIDTIVNIGIGGSDLGPLMAVEALRPYWLPGKRSRFVSNVDGQHLSDILAECDPARTLFIIASKTFTTQETMTNAASARAWFLENGGDEETVAQHFIALSTNEIAVADFGIAPENMFVFWDWVGGRYSMWSAIGMAIALQVGADNFERLLRGAHAMDEHFREAPIRENLPVILALVGIWNRNFIGAAAHAILPYDQHLHRLPAYLQQADMESNGKSVLLDGSRTQTGTGPILFGEPGTNGQHAFYQLMHQGTDTISADFIAPALSATPLADHHEKLLANFLAQTEALMIGRDFKAVCKELEALEYPAAQIEQIAPHRVFDGDRPTNSILIERLTPETLGALIAMYEHKIFCQGVIWGINSFDQWGVELGKTLAKRILPKIANIGGEVLPISDHDGSTARLINRVNTIRSQAETD